MVDFRVFPQTGYLNTKFGVRVFGKLKRNQKYRIIFDGESVSREFETLNDAQKEQVITDLHNRWSDPDSEIVKRMNNFSEKSPEI